MMSLLLPSRRLMAIVTVLPILTGLLVVVAADTASDSDLAECTLTANEFDSPTTAPQNPIIEAAGLVIDSDPVIEAERLMFAENRAGDSTDRLWVISTRQLTNNPCRMNLDDPALNISRLSCGGRGRESSLDEYLSASPSRPVVVYVHGNRMTSCDAIERGLFVYRSTFRCRPHPVDWVIWSWPSEKCGILAHDARLKADRTDAQGLYLAWLLRNHLAASRPTTLIGFSFGGRIVTGSLHALAGGVLGHRRLPGEPINGAAIDTGLVAPAIESDWLTARGYHSMATKNMDQLVLLYNRRDAVLKNYWRIERVRNVDALGYSGPTAFGTRADGSRLPVRSKDCSPTIGLKHDEVDYYNNTCRAGFLLGSLIHDSATE